MSLQIDQSGKIEATNKNTILCLSNDEWFALKLEAITKRQLQEIFRRNGQPRNFVLFTFCAGLAILLDMNDHIHNITIDQEYSGKDSVIKNIVLEMIEQKRRPLEINFGRIGKKALAHHRAYAVATGKIKASYKAGLNELLHNIKMTEVGKRLKNA